MSYINSLTKEQLIRRLVLLGQVAKEINADLAKMGYADEDGNVNTCSVAEIDGDGRLGGNVVDLFLLADLNSDHAEKRFLTDGEYNKKTDIHMTCDKCGHIEYYEDETDMFQGEMFGLEDKTIVCKKCVNNLHIK